MTCRPNWHKVYAGRYMAIVNGNRVEVEKTSTGWFYFINDRQPGQTVSQSLTEVKAAALNAQAKQTANRIPA